MVDYYMTGFVEQIKLARVLVEVPSGLIVLGNSDGIWTVLVPIHLSNFTLRMKGHRSAPLFISLNWFQILDPKFYF